MVDPGWEAQSDPVVIDELLSSYACSFLFFTTVARFVSLNASSRISPLSTGVGLRSLVCCSTSWRKQATIRLSARLGCDGSPSTRPGCLLDRTLLSAPDADLRDKRNGY